MFPLYNNEKFQVWAKAHGLAEVTTLQAAQWLTIDGKMYGVSVTDQRPPHEIQQEVESYLASWPAYQALTITKNNFWSIVHEATGLVRVVPETEIVRTMIGQALTSEQQVIIAENGYELEPYTKNRNYFAYNL